MVSAQMNKAKSADMFSNPFTLESGLDQLQEVFPNVAEITIRG
jgi:hypothetical protein